MQLSKIPHYTTLQKFAVRMNGTLLYRIISSFILLTRFRKMLMGIGADASTRRTPSNGDFMVWFLQRAIT